MTTRARFEAKFISNESTGCWDWIAAKSGSGYGSFGMGKRPNVKICLAHRVSYSLYRGEIPAGVCVLHRCDNPGCVNPDHLFLGTHQDNMADKVKKNRQAKNHVKPGMAASGEKHGHAKLTKDDVEEIRRVYVPGVFGAGRYREANNLGSRALALRFGVRRQTILSIVKGNTWKDD